ncbi:hypothetical protein KM043_007245 [Ampulex compressa]|nr:hypothetical protein KM043_007245 [Ampulex compressa]
MSPAAKPFRLTGVSKVVGRWLAMVGGESVKAGPSASLHRFTQWAKQSNDDATAGALWALLAPTALPPTSVEVLGGAHARRCSSFPVFPFPFNPAASADRLAFLSFHEVKCRSISRHRTSLRCEPHRTGERIAKLQKENRYARFPRSNFHRPLDSPLLQIGRHSRRKKYLEGAKGVPFLAEIELEYEEPSVGRNFGHSELLRLDSSMESSGSEKQNESDECDVSGDNRRKSDMTVQEEKSRVIAEELGERETLKNRKNLENSGQTEAASRKAAKRLSKRENQENRVSDEEEQKDEKRDEKKEEESSSSATSSSSSDDESETSSEEKTEPSKPEETTKVTEPPPKKKEEQQSSKNEDTTDDSDIEDDLVSAINYNTITSLAALKDMLQSSGEDSDGVDSFFHHYFLSHVNRLPSRNQTHSPYPWGRRLSECREEDEYETEEGKNTDLPSIVNAVEAKRDSPKGQDSQEKAESVSSKASSPASSEKSSSERIDQKSSSSKIDASSVAESKSTSTTTTTVTTSPITATTVIPSNVTTSTAVSTIASTPTTSSAVTVASSRFTTSTVTSPTSGTKPPLRRRHTTGPGMTFPATDPPTYSSSMTFSRTSPLPSPHLDKRFFDSSLIEMKSQASSSSTLDYDSTEEVWVRRVDFVQERKRRELGSQPLPTIVTEDADNSGHASQDQGHRPRAGTWGSHSRSIRKPTSGSAPGSGKSTPLPQQQEASSSSSSSKGGRKASGTRSGSTSRSNSRSNSAERRRSGGGTEDTASPTRKPALFDAFRPRSKSDASKRKPSIIANMKSAVQHSLHRGSHGSSSVDVHTEKDHHRDSREHKESNQTGRPRAGSESSRNPVSKVMDLIRHRSHSALNAEDKRKARAAAQHQAQIAAQKSVTPCGRSSSFGQSSPVRIGSPFAHVSTITTASKCRCSLRAARTAQG